MKASLKKLFTNLRKGKIPAILKNKYLLVAIAFLSWMLFFDNNDIISQVQLRMKLSEYRNKKEYYEQKIAEVKKEKQELLTNQQSLEKFAREQYMMKKDDEDLFVIVPEKKEKWYYQDGVFEKKFHGLYLSSFRLLYRCFPIFASN